MISTLDFGISFVPDVDGKTVDTFKDWGCYLAAPPVYGSRQRKEMLVEIPFCDVPLDFSKIDGSYHYEETENEYSLVYISESSNGATQLEALRSKVSEMENYLWNFKGSVSDAFLPNHSLKYAKVSSVEYTFYPNAGALRVDLIIKGCSNV